MSKLVTFPCGLMRPMSGSPDEPSFGLGNTVANQMVPSGVVAMDDSGRSKLAGSGILVTRPVILTRRISLLTMTSSDFPRPAAMPEGSPSTPNGNAVIIPSGVMRTILPVAVNQRLPSAAAAI
jgi:hypothetical protein